MFLGEKKEYEAMQSILRKLTPDRAADRKDAGNGTAVRMIPDGSVF